eukprot:1393466-Amphidinium_carterae.1
MVQCLASERSTQTSALFYTKACIASAARCNDSVVNSRQMSDWQSQARLPLQTALCCRMESVPRTHESKASPATMVPDLSYGCEVRGVNRMIS